MNGCYFIVLDEAPVPGSPRAKFDLLYGDPWEAVGVLCASARSARGLLALVPAGEPVYRRYLQRTDGRRGVRRVLGPA